MQMSKLPVFVTALLAAAQFVAAAATLNELLPAAGAAWFVLIVGAAQAGVAVYQRGAVPAASVAAAYDVHGSLVAGPAAPQRVGAPVAVLSLTDSGVDEHGDAVFLTPAAEVDGFGTSAR